MITPAVSLFGPKISLVYLASAAALNAGDSVFAELKDPKAGEQLRAASREVTRSGSYRARSGYWAAYFLVGNSQR